MGRSKHLDRETIREKLRTRQVALLEEVRDEFDQRDNQHLIDLMGREPGDSGDLSLADEVADLNIAMADRQIRELREIDAAFDRLKGTDFGLCADCGEEIESSRLLAWPTATRCLKCQERHERLSTQPIPSSL